MATPVQPIGSGPNGGTIFQMDDGSQQEISGTPGVVGGGGFAKPVAPAPAPSSDDIPGPLRMPAAFASGLFGGADSGAAALNEARHPNMAAAGQMVGSVFNPGRLVQNYQPQIQQAADFLADRSPQGTPAPAQPVAPQEPLRFDQPGPGGQPTQEAPQGPLSPGQLQLPGGSRGPGGPSYSKQAGAAADAEGKAIDKTAEAEGAQARLKGEGLQQVAAQETADLSSALGQRQAVMKEHRANMAKVQAAQDALDQQHEDPNHWWSTRDTGQKVAATISLALGAFGQAFTGHNGSPVQDMINKDIEAQRNNYARSRDSIAAQRSAYGQLMQQGLSDVEATLVLKKGQTEASLRTLDGMLSASSPDYIKAKAAQQKAALQADLVKTKAQLDAEAAQTAHANVATQAARQQMLFGQQDRARMLAFQQGQGPVPPELAGRAIYSPEGKVLGLAPSEKEAESTRQMVGDASGLMKEIDEAKRLAQAWGSSSNKTEAGAAYKAKLDAIIGKLNSAQGIQQAVGEEQRKLYMETFGNTATTPTAATLSGLDGLSQTLRTNVNSRLQSFGPGMRPLYGAEPTPAQQQALRAAGR